MSPNSLQQVIEKKIRREGPITFETFMKVALYHPEMGYYMAPDARIGPEGDFFTSPHLHPIFGWLIAIQMDQMKQITEDPEGFTILEIGAGRGYLAEGVIDFIQKNLGWERDWHYIIVEKNPHAIQTQKKLLDGYNKDLIVWKSSFDEVDPFYGCVIANEVLDAFPVHMIVMSNQIQEIYVGLEKEGFTELYDEISASEVLDYIKRYNIPMISGYRTEINLGIFDYLEKLNKILKEGFIISIDYGYTAHEYYSEQRHRGTFLCYYQHKVNEEPFKNVGDQDMTAHVNFTSLRDWGNELGIKTIGYCPQGTFLASLGIDKMISQKLETHAGFHKELLKIKSLLFDLGESHHVMMQYKGGRDFESLKGLKLSNRIDRL